MKKVSIESKKVFLHNRRDIDRNLRIRIDNSMVTSIERGFVIHPSVNMLDWKTDFRELMMRIEILPE